MSSNANDGHARSPVEIPLDIFERVSTLRLARPEAAVRVDVSRIRARTTAHSFDIRRRSFCLLVAREVHPTGAPVPLLVLRSDADERDVWLTDDTDWEEIRELVTESYRRLAPKKPTAGLDGERRQ